MLKNKNKIISIVTILVAVVLALSPFHLFPVCQHLMKNGRHMSCYYSAWFFIGTAIVIILLSVVNLLAKKKWISYLCHGLVFVVAVLGYLVPHRMIEVGHMKLQGWQIGFCASPEMACQTGTMPAVNIILILLGVLSIAGLSLLLLTDNQHK